MLSSWVLTAAKTDVVEIEKWKSDYIQHRFYGVLIGRADELDTG